MSDLIDRQDAIDALIKADYELTGILSEPRARMFEQTINALPSAQPEYTEQDVRDAFNDGYRCGMEFAQPTQNNTSNALKSLDCVDRQAAIDAWKADFKGYIDCLDLPRDDYNGIMEYIDQAPSAQPERMRGKWITTNKFEDCYYAKCNECKVTQVFYYNKALTNFCPNCGADMRGEL